MDASLNVHASEKKLILGPMENLLAPMHPAYNIAFRHVDEAKQMTQ
jgi:hypothetical protein